MIFDIFAIISSTIGLFHYRSNRNLELLQYCLYAGLGLISRSSSPLANLIFTFGGRVSRCSSSLIGWGKFSVEELVLGLHFHMNAMKGALHAPILLNCAHNLIKNR